jgi:hypothetical protein
MFAHTNKRARVSGTHVDVQAAAPVTRRLKNTSKHRGRLNTEKQNPLQDRSHLHFSSFDHLICDVDILGVMLVMVELLQYIV